MFSGESTDVKLRFTNDLINPVLDRFGKDITIIPDGDESFSVHVNVKAEAPFYAWLFMFGSKAEIIEPDHLREKYKEQLKTVLTILE